MARPSKLTLHALLAWLSLLPWAPIVYGVKSPKALDLSYKHYLEPSVLEEVIRRSLWDLEEGEERPASLEVDISSSVLGNEQGMKGIFQALLPVNESSTTGTPVVEIHLSSRGNRVTPKIMDDLFQILLTANANKTQTVPQPSPVNNEIINTTIASNSSSAEATNETKTPEENTTRSWKMNTLDVGWNELHPNVAGWKGFLKSLQKLLQSRDICPQTIRLDRCGLGPGACRAIGKGIINRYSSPDEKTKPAIPLSLHFCGNPDLGDSGTAALAAAIRTVVADAKNNNDVILDTLDLSACEVGDAGAEALAMALESCPCLCIRHLDLSNNKISDIGATAIAHALLASGSTGPALESLDLSGNTEIRDQSASALADAVGKGLISCITLRSCHILADGAAAFGKAIHNLAMNSNPNPASLHIDLSGNPFGILRGKTKKGNKYSASAIKSKATATTSAYMSIIRKGIKSGLKDYGVDIPGSTVDSDDDEEARDGMGGELTGEGDPDPGKGRCGIKAFANAILDADDNSEDSESYPSRSTPFQCTLGLRRCFLDHSAADALAAVLVHSQDDMGINLNIDIDLNPVLEEDMTDAIQGNEAQDMLLRDMSDRYHDALDALRAARERAVEAARTAAARIEADAELEAQWDAPQGLGDERWDEDDDWDSDADYEQEDAEYDY